MGRTDMINQLLVASISLPHAAISSIPIPSCLVSTPPLFLLVVSHAPAAQRGSSSCLHEAETVVVRRRNRYQRGETDRLRAGKEA